MGVSFVLGKYVTQDAGGGMAVTIKKAVSV